MFRWQGDQAVVVEFDGPLADANARARAAGAAVADLAGVAGVVPAARSLLVRLSSDADPEALAAMAADAAARPAAAGPAEHRIEVRYDGEDIDAVAAECGLAPNEVVALHAGATYTVAFLGFMPGFAYLLGLPDALRVPRRTTPRTRVEAGAVAVAGEWAGVYPSRSPGGWRILGHGDVALFDPARPNPATLAPGDLVRFVET